MKSNDYGDFLSDSGLKTILKDKREKKKLNIISIDSVEATPRAEDHLEDWLPQKGLILVTGAKGAGKTGVLFSIMHNLTSGKRLG